MSGEDLFQYLPKIMAVLADRAGGTIELSDRDVERIATMGPVDLEFWKSDIFTGPNVKIRYVETVNIQGETVAAADGCTCYVTPEKYWTTHYGAVEPGSMIEPNPDCREHFGGMEISVRDLLGAAPDFTGGLSVDEYMGEQRGRGQE